MAEPLRVTIAGLGTVGVGVIKNIQTHGAMLEKRSGRKIEIVAIHAQNRDKKRDADISSYEWVDDITELAARPDVDIIIELIGGSDGVALTLARKALANKKHFITANKALIAHHGYELAVLAEENGVALSFEAAVAGGIPVIKSLREGFAGNEIQAVYGILNGTSNYILTEMRETGRDFESVLKDAQDKGYAESDPSFDIDGVDAGHKLSILTALAFGTKPDFKSLEMIGIRHINSTDIAFASELGYRIKLLGIARRYEDGRIMQILEPCLVPKESTLGTVEGVYNAVHIDGDFVQTGHLVGRGAGEKPTASAVISDVIDIARGFKVPVFGVPATKLKEANWIDVGQTVNCYYVRMNVLDQPGVLADVSAILRDHNVSIEAFLQRGRDPGQPVPMVMTTHETRHADMTEACARIEKLQTVLEKPCLMPIENI
jgi:homoserine dehydrogenase